MVQNLRVENTGRCAIDVELWTTIPEPSTVSCRAILKTSSSQSVHMLCSKLSADIHWIRLIFGAARPYKKRNLCFNFNNYIQFSQITRSETCCCINLFCPTWLYHALCCLPWCDGSRTDINELKYQQRIVCSYELSPKIYINMYIYHYLRTGILMQLTLSVRERIFRVRNVETHLCPSQTFS